MLTCKHCQAGFVEASPSGQRLGYCSEKCRKARKLMRDQELHPRKGLYDLTCGHCFKDFTARQKIKFCSRTCKARHASSTTGTCVHCRAGFSFPCGRGRKGIYCSFDCRLKHNFARRQLRLESLTTCSTEGCTGRATRVGAGQCEKCYYRVRQTGTVWRPKCSGKYTTAAGYTLLKKPKHALARKDGLVFEHRAVIYDAVGGGMHPCFWCGKMLAWDNIVVDHLDESKANNDLDNLVVSCNTCNRARGAMLPFIARMKPESFPVLLEQMLKYRREVACVETENLWSVVA